MCIRQCFVCMPAQTVIKSDALTSWFVVYLPAATVAANPWPLARGQITSVTFSTACPPYHQRPQMSNIISWIIVIFRDKEMKLQAVCQPPLTRLPSPQTHHPWQKIRLLPRVTPSLRHLGNCCRGEPPSGIADPIRWLISTELQSTALPHRLVWCAVYHPTNGLINWSVISSATLDGVRGALTETWGKLFRFVLSVRGNSFVLTSLGCWSSLDPLFLHQSSSVNEES